MTDRGPLHSTPPPAKGRAPEQWSSRYFGGLLGQDKLPFRQMDWPNPILRAKPPPDQWTASYFAGLIGKDLMAFRWQEWPNPILRKQDAPPQWTWSYNLNLIGKDFLPFRQEDWPLQARGPAQPDRTWLNLYDLNLIGQDLLPNRQQDWPLTVAKLADRSWVQGTNPNLTVIIAPFAQYDWQTPRGALPANQSFLNWYNQNLIGRDALPNRQVDWPLTAARLGDRSWVQGTNLNINAVVIFPFTQYDWPVPRGVPPSNQSFLGWYNQNLVSRDALPARQLAWPNPQLPFSSNYSYLQGSNVSFYPPPITVIAPFAMYDWPMPRGWSPPNLSAISQTNIALGVPVPPVHPVPPGPMALRYGGRPSYSVRFGVIPRRVAGQLRK